MGSRPKDPNEVFRSAAQKSVKRALNQQKKVTKNLQKQTGEYLGKNAPQNYAQATRKLERASGRTFPEYVENAEANFFTTARDLTEQGRRDLRTFDPNLIGSASTSRLTDYLSAVGQDFARGVQDVGESGRDRLFALPEQAQNAFTASALNPAFENLRNAEYVNFAKEPPTVANDAMKMYRNIFTYNV